MATAVDPICDAETPRLMSKNHPEVLRRANPHQSVGIARTAIERIPIEPPSDSQASAAPGNTAQRVKSQATENKNRLYPLHTPTPRPRTRSKRNREHRARYSRERVYKIYVNHRRLIQTFGERSIVIGMLSFDSLTDQEAEAVYRDLYPLIKERFEAVITKREWQKREAKHFHFAAAVKGGVDVQGKWQAYGPHLEHFMNELHQRFPRLGRTSIAPIGSDPNAISRYLAKKCMGRSYKHDAKIFTCINGAAFNAVKSMRDIAPIELDQAKAAWEHLYGKRRANPRPRVTKDKNYWIARARLADSRKRLWAVDSKLKQRLAPKGQLFRLAIAEQAPTSVSYPDMLGYSPNIGRKHNTHWPLAIHWSPNRRKEYGHQ